MRRVESASSVQNRCPFQKGRGARQFPGRLIWSVDITTPDSKDITEVNVDAKSGEVIAVTKETPEQEKNEKESPRR